MIVCFGDSITAGQHVDPDLAWPALVRASTGEDISVAAVPGDTSRLAMERFARDVQVPRPEAVIIQFGHNDANRWQTDGGVPRVSNAGFQANLEEMVARCRAFGIQPIFCSLTPSQRSELHELDCSEYNSTLVAMSAYLDVPLINVRSVFTPPDGLLLDGLHLNEAGHRLYAGVVIHHLNAWRGR